MSLCCGKVPLSKDSWLQDDADTMHAGILDACDGEHQHAQYQVCRHAVCVRASPPLALALQVCLSLKVIVYEEPLSAKRTGPTTNSIGRHPHATYN